MERKKRNYGTSGTEFVELVLRTFDFLNHFPRHSNKGRGRGQVPDSFSNKTVNIHTQLIATLHNDLSRTAHFAIDFVCFFVCWFVVVVFCLYAFFLACFFAFCLFVFQPSLKNMFYSFESWNPLLFHRDIIKDTNIQILHISDIILINPGRNYFGFVGENIRFRAHKMLPFTWSRILRSLCRSFRL